MKIHQTLWMGVALMAMPASLNAADVGILLGGSIGEVMGPKNVNIPAGDFVPPTGGASDGFLSQIFFLQTDGAVSGGFSLIYNPNCYIGVEANYTLLGEQDVIDTDGSGSENFHGKLRSYFYGINAIGYLPMDTVYIDLFARVGIGALHAKMTIDDSLGSVFVNPGSYHATTNKLALDYGAGAQYHFSYVFAGNIQVRRISSLQNRGMSNLNFTQVTIGVTYVMPWI